MSGPIVELTPVISLNNSETPDESIVLNNSSSASYSEIPHHQRIKSWTEIEFAVYLNLYYRKARNQSIRKELRRFCPETAKIFRVAGFQSKYNANQKYKDGEFGRSRGHIKMLDLAARMTFM
jgi:hypothetical protein